jgi:hypothetical protein
MEGMISLDDRRDLDRVVAKDGVFASLSSSHQRNSARLTRVIDISEQGFSAVYFGVDKLEGTVSSVTLFWTDRFHCHLELPCRVVHDSAIAGEFFGPFILRRCGVEFLRVSPEQLRHLRYFLKRCARGAN